MTERHRATCAATGKPRQIIAGIRFGLLYVSLGCIASGVVLAQSKEAESLELKPNWRIVPRAAVDLTYTDNVAPGRGTKTSDLITRLSPGIRVDGKSSRASGSFDYSWQQNLYASNSQYDNDQQSLRANGKLELVDQWLFLDASGNISQQPISAFGTQGVGNELVNTNRTETSSYQLSPYIRGRLIGAADYELRYSNTQTNANSGVIATYGGTSSEAWTGRLAGSTPFTLLGWSLTADSQNLELGSTRRFETSRYAGALEFRIDPQVKLSVSAGWESDNYSMDQWRRRTTSGYGIEWAPTERSLLSFKQDKRSYGNSHSLTFSHRTALTAWKLSDTRSVSLPGQQLTVAPITTAYELLNQYLTNLYPDPIERAQVVLKELALLDINPNHVLWGAFMNTQATVQRRQEASVALMGANNTVTLSVQRSSSERIGTGLALPGDDLLLTSNIRQTGLSGSWAHKLSPHSSLTLNALTSRNRGLTSNLDTRLRSLQLSLTKKLGEHTSATAGMRSTSYDNAGGNSYDEQAVMGSFLVTF